MRLGWLVVLSSCYCPGSQDQIVKLHFEVANAEALRDASAVSCWTSAATGERRCASGLLGVGRLGTLQFDTPHLWSTYVSIDAPEAEARGSLVLRWSWSDPELLAAGDRYGVTVRDAAGNTLFSGERAVAYRSARSESCEDIVRVEQTLP